MNIDFDQLPENSVLKRLYRACIRSHPQFAQDITQAYPQVDILLTINNKELSPLALMQVLCAEEILLQTQIAQLRQSPPPPPPPPPPPTTATALDQLVGINQKQVVMGEYVVMGTQRYKDLALLTQNMVNQIISWANQEVAYTAQHRQEMLRVLETPMNLTNRTSIDDTLTRLQDMLGARDNV